MFFRFPQIEDELASQEMKALQKREEKYQEKMKKRKRREKEEAKRKRAMTRARNF